MRFRPPALLLIGFGIGPVLLAAGCGGDGAADGPGGTLVNIQPTSFVVKEPETSTTTTTIAFTEAIVGGTAPLEQVYIVEPDDSLSRIASIHDITMELLVSYNATVWPEGAAHVFLVGEEVKIPPGAKIPGTATATDSGTAGETDTPADGTSVPGVGCQHTIVGGEFPNRVANQYDITVDELIAANPGGVMDTFLVGAVLNIPANGTC